MTPDLVDHVEAFTVPYVEPNDHGSTRWVCLVKVTTKDGVVGWGEGVALFEEAARATTEVVRGLAAHVVGHPARTDDVDRAVTDRAWWYGDSGIACFARAAIDTALWDIRGRTLGVSLVDLLGGPVHDSLPTVLSTHATRADLTEMAGELAAWVADTKTIGVKVGFGKAGDAHLGYEHDRDVSFVAALRDALGESAAIMVDVGARLHWSPEEAIARTLAFETHGLTWIEEPLGARHPLGYAALRRATDARIAYGEREWTVTGVQDIVDSGTVDVVGIDPGRLGGVTGFVRAATIAHAAGVQVNAHAFAGPITYAVSLALSLASPACHQLEVPPHRNQLYDVVGLPDSPVEGRVTACHRPGLGFDVDEQAVRDLCAR